MISLRNVRKVYKTGQVNVEALKGVHLDIDVGEMVVLNGVSGSGKTTLLNLIGAMDIPTSGKISIDGEEITTYSNAKLTKFRAKKVGYIFQHFNLIPALNVYENIIVPLKLKSQKFNKNSIMNLIMDVGLQDYIRHRSDELSGGQRQRVAIARALASNPSYIMADEPTANLDSKTASQILGLLKELNKKTKVTIVFASHDPFLNEFVEKKIHISDGVILD
jgi:putative ABC transport system ATP-binding protein